MAVEFHKKRKYWKKGIFKNAANINIKEIMYTNVYIETCFGNKLTLQKRWSGWGFGASFLVLKGGEPGVAARWPVYGNTSAPWYAEPVTFEKSQHKYMTS